jgi:hypothetical protein
MNQIPLLVSVVFFLGLVGNAPAQVPTGELRSGLVSFYPFQGDFRDVIGGNNLVNFGATFTSNQHQTPASAIAVTPRTYLISERNVGISGNQTRTVSLWVNVQTNTSWPNGRLVSWGKNYSADSERFWLLYGANSLVGDYNRQINGVDFKNSLGTWQHIVFAYSDSITNTAFYVNGVLCENLQWSSLIGSFSINTFDSPLCINGDSSDGESLGVAGSISSVGIWNRTLTAAEVLDLYNSQRPVYDVTLTLKSSTNLNQWENILTNKIETYNPAEFYKTDISVTIKQPSP